MGDMVEQEAKYHCNCLLNLYNRARKITEMGDKGSDDEHAIAGLAFAELVIIKEAHMDDEMSLISKLVVMAIFQNFILSLQ